MASYRQVNVHDSSRGHGGRRVRRVHPRKRPSRATVARAFGLMCVIIGVGSICRSLR
jgi:hypothetical protein